MDSRTHKETAEEVRQHIADLEEELSHPTLDVGRSPKAEIESRRESADQGGDIWSLLLGIALAAVGGYFVANQVIVTSGYMALFGPATFGILLVPFVLGIGLLVFGNGQGRLGSGLVAASVLLMLADVLADLRITIQPTTLVQVLLMFALLASGLGLVARSLRSRK
jgi:hypothetical protein